MRNDAGTLPLKGWAGGPATPIECREWLVDGLLYRDGLTLLSAGKGWGKTTFIVNLLTAIASGGDFLGRQVRKGLVLHYAAEETTAEYEQRLQSMEFPPSPDTYLYSTAAPRNREDALSRIADEIKDRHPVVVALDPIGDFLTFVDLNEYSTKAAFMELKNLRDRFPETHIIATHHSTKAHLLGSATMDKAMASVNGSIAVQSYFNKMFLGAGSVEMDCRDLFIWSRTQAPSRMRLRIDPATGRLTVDAGEVRRSLRVPKLPVRAAKALQFIRSASKSITKSDLRERFHLPTASDADSVLAVLMEASLVEVDLQATLSPDEWLTL